VRLTAFDTEDKARAEHRKGLSRLFALQLAAQVKAVEKLPGLRETALQFISLGTEKELREQLVAVTLERTCLMDPLPAEESAFAARREAARGRILLVAQEILRLVGTCSPNMRRWRRSWRPCRRPFRRRPPTSARNWPS
jgi:ATP-dependent helicase HrpA